MPVFEYVCNRCGREFEELMLSANDADRVRCPQCSGAVTRKISAFAAASPSSGAASLPLPTGGCGRCGDPSGPCSIG